MTDALRIRLFGTLEVEGLDGAALPRRQMRTLLRILALEAGRPVAVDTLVDRIWGDDPPARAQEQVAVLVSRLRKAIGADRVERTDAGYLLHADWVDVSAVEGYAEEARRRLDGGAAGSACAAAVAGLGLVRGPLLADEPDPWWAATHRARVDGVVARLAATGAAAALAGHDWAGAAELARSGRHRAPHDEVLLRIEMEALARSGRPAAALSAYAEARAGLAADLGVSPNDDTESLHAAILRDELPGARPQAAAGSDLPGRGAELAALDALLDGAERGSGQLCLVQGEAGIGKTSLLTAWRRRAAARGATVVAVEATELGRALPLQPLLDALDALGRQAGAGRDVLGDSRAVLGPLLAGQHEPAPPAQLDRLTDPNTGRALVFAAILAVLQRQAAAAPLVLTIDDLHLADPATLAWLAYAGPRLDRSPVTVVAAQRVEEGAVLPGVPVVDLGPVDLDAAVEIVGAGRAVSLHQRSGGHPLFLVELAAADPTGALPTSIRAAVEERCRRAGPAGATLQAAAEIGPVIDLDVLAAATATGPGTLLDHLEEGVRRRLLDEAGTGFAFRHPLIRDALAGTVSASRAAFVHREASRVLAGRPNADPATVAHHARRGGDPALASQMLVLAARRASSRFDHDEALRLLDEAVGLDDTAAARLERARVHTVTARYAAADDDVAAAWRLGATADAAEVAAWSAHLQRRFDKALPLADDGAASAADPDVRTSCLALGGWVCLMTGDLDGSNRRLTQALEVPGAPSRPLAEAWMGWLLLNRGAADDALRLVAPRHEGGLATYRHPTAYALMVQAMGAGMLGRPEDALGAVDRLEAEVERVGARRWRPRPLNLRAWVLRNLGATGEADDLNRAAADMARDDSLGEPLANALLDLAAGRLCAGAVDAAVALLDEVDALAPGGYGFRWRHVLRSRLLRARCELVGGDAEAAAVGAASLAEDAGEAGTDRYARQALLVAALARHRRGDDVDRAEVHGLLLGLGAVAGLESWWITAEVAHAFDEPRWSTLADERVAALLARAGDHRRTLEAAAAGRLC